MACVPCDHLAEEECEGSERKKRKKFYLVSVSAATGSLHKAVVPQDSSAYLVEEIQLSPDSEPVRNLQLAPAQVRRDLNRTQSSCGEQLGSPGQGARAPDTLHLFAQGAVFAGFSGGIWRVPRANCSVYESCVDCVLARDPHCAWDPESRLCSLLSGSTK